MTTLVMDNFLYFVIFIMLIIIGFVLGVEATGDYFEQQGEIEVYKGNTKLKYEVVDSVRVDSCVIFINKK